MGQSIRVLFEPLGRMGEARPGDTLLDVAVRCGVGLRSDCGGAGTCGKCRVVVDDQRSVTGVDPAEGKQLTSDELLRGYRLACIARILPAARRVVVRVPEESRLRARRFSGGEAGRKVRLDPVVKGLDVYASSPRPLGLAVDIGTSRITARLIDLSSGSTLGSESIENPGIAHGENLITRASYAQASGDNLRRLRGELLGGVNALAERLTGDVNDILQTVVVGNTVMHHLFLGLDTTRLTRAPFTPAIREMVWLSGLESGLSMNPLGVVAVLPNIDAFLGADAVADIVSSNLLRRGEPTLLLDVGTNTELILRAGGETLVCSCASGPAFEGEHIEHGMKAVEGAIESVGIGGDGAVTYGTVGGVRPVGICGSGIVDAVAELLRRGMISPVGRFTAAASPRVVSAGNQRKFVIATPVESGTGSSITVSERDINEVILAKAAIGSGTSVLMAMKGVEPSDLRGVLVAGAFGGHLNKSSAKSIGLLPAVENRRIAFLGNAALEGATMALKSRKMIDFSSRIAAETKYVELASNPDFDVGFRRALLLGGAKRY